MSGPRGDNVVVQCMLVGSDKFKCMYTPKWAGAHSLYISWADREVGGSPYDVNVIPSAESSKVVVGMEGLQAGWTGQDMTTTIDTRRAGQGKYQFVWDRVYIRLCGTVWDMVYINL